MRPLISRKCVGKMNNKFAGKGGSQLPQPVDLTPYFDMANSIVKHNEELDQGKSKNIEMVRLMLKKKMAHSFLGQLYEWLLIIFSTASTMQYIFTTYYVFIEYETEELLQKANRDVLNPLNNLERFWSVMFLLDLLLYLFLADSKMMYISRFVVHKVVVACSDNRSFYTVHPCGSLSCHLFLSGYHPHGDLMKIIQLHGISFTVLQPFRYCDACVYTEKLVR